MFRYTTTFIFVLFVITNLCFAQISEQQVLVIYNSQSDDGEDVFNYYKSQPNRGNVLGFDLNNSTLVGSDISYSDFVSKIRDPIRNHLSANNLAEQIVVLVLTRGIPHRIQDFNNSAVGDSPLGASSLFQNSNATFASVDSELMLLWQNLEAGEANGSFDSNADNVIRNPYFGVTQSITSFSRTGTRGVAQTNKTFTEETLFWTMSDNTLRASDGGDLYLTSRLDGNSLDAVRSLIDRGQSPVYDPSSDIIIQDKNSTGTFEGSDYDDASNLLNGRWRNLDYDQSNDFLIGSGGNLVDPSGPTRTIAGQVAIYTGYGGNHDNFNQTGYIATFNGQLTSGAIFSAYESYNGRAFNDANGFGDQGQLADWIDAGGGFAIGNVWEPFTFGVPRNNELFDAFLFQDLTWAEAAWSSIQFLSWQTIVIGDPLAVATVIPLQNADPSANSFTQTTTEDSATQLTLDATDPDGDSLTYEFTQPTNGIISGTAPNLTYTPADHFFGTDSFTYTASDGLATSNTATVSIDISEVNDIPIANDVDTATIEDNSVAITLSGSDIEGSALSFLIGQPANGSLSGTAPNLTYTPTANFSGTDSFAFTVNDGTTDSDPATVTIQVTAENDPPVASSQNVATTEDHSVAIALEGFDVDGDSISYQLSSQPSNGTLAGTAPNLTYSPNANFSGADNFTFIVSDSSIQSAAATVNISVTAVNDAPTATSDAISLSEDSSATILIQGQDIDSENLTFQITSSPSNGSLSGTAPNLTYTPTAHFFGTDSFEFTVNDGALTSQTASISLTIESVNDLPVSNNQSIATLEDTSVEINLSASDQDNDPLTYQIVAQPSNGTIAQDQSKVTYTPNPGFFGTDLLTFRANDGTQDSSADASIFLTIQEVPAIGFEAFLEANPTIVESGFDGDFDNDGLSNGLEYVLATNPTEANQSPLLALTIVQAGTEITFDRNAESAADTRQTFQFSEDAENWTDLSLQAPLSSEIELGAIEQGLQPVTVTINGDHDKLFWRLIVEPLTSE